MATAPIGCAAAALAGGASGSRSRPRPRRLRLAAAFPQVAAADDGRADRRARSTSRFGAGSEVARLDARASAGWSPPAPARWAGPPASTSSTTAAWAGSAPSTLTEVLALARASAADPDLELAGVWTHFATADEPDDDEGYFFEQLDRFEPVAEAVRAEFPGGHRPRRQQRRRLPRSARSHFDMARCGVAIYGLDPFQVDPRRARPRAGAVAALLRRRREALRGRAERRLRPPLAGAGRHLGRGRCRSATATGCAAASPTTATSWSRGRRYPLVGTVSMDNLTIDLGPETEVEPGAEAVLIGRQGEEEILAEEIAAPPRHDQLRGHLRDLRRGCRAERRA